MITPSKWQAERAGGRMKARRAKTRHKAGFGLRQPSAQRPANGLPVELTEPLNHNTRGATWPSFQIRRLAPEINSAPKEVHSRNCPTHHRIAVQNGL